jgi:SulP family sulfate permease
VTLVSTLALPLEWAILVGAGLGLVIHLARTSVPRVRLLKPDDPAGGHLLPLKAGEAPSTLVVEVSGALHYAAVDPFLAEVEHRLPPSARTVIMDLTHTHEMRFTALTALERFAADLTKKGVRLRLAGVPPEVCEMMRLSGSRLRATPAEDEPTLSVRKCLQSVEAEQDEQAER